MNQPSTFWELISKYEVRIPLFQRDYAQGREDKRVEGIRQDFVKTLAAVFDERAGGVNLDLIYGTCDGDKLVLIDGQQRVTTLFLLHWYVALRAGFPTNSIVHRTLCRFGYDTRTTSRDFCHALVQNATADLIGGSDVSSVLRDACWFRDEWNHDPTVKSMLVMLDAIHDHFKDTPLDESSWRRLVDPDQAAISFHFLETNAMGLTDDLYIKMNARGIALSEFEEFKAWLEGYVQEQGWFFPSLSGLDWTHLIDTRWTDLFWKYRTLYCEIDGEQSCAAGRLFLRLFQSIATFSLAEDAATPSAGAAQGNDPEQRIKRINDGEYISVSEYERWKCFNANVLSRCFALLNRLSTRDGGCIADLKRLVAPDNYTDRVLAYAYFLFTVGAQLEEAGYERNMSTWSRITGNLIRNTPIDHPGDLIRSVGSLESLWKNIKKARTCDGDWVLMAFAEMVEDNVSFFSRTQVKEEILKAKLAQKDHNWEKSLIKAEGHEYFFGQIGFLLEYAKAGSCDYNQAKFDEYAAKAGALFHSYLLKTSEHLVERALLVKGDYLPKVNVVGQKYSFCRPETGRLRDRNENWRGVFNDTERSGMLKALLDAVATDAAEQSLRKIITFTQGLEEWRKLIIECPEAIEMCTQGHIHWEDSGEKVYLLSKKRMSCRHAELRSFYLLHRFLREPGQESGEAAKQEFVPFTRATYDPKCDDNDGDPPCAVLASPNFHPAPLELRIAYRAGKEGKEGVYNLTLRNSNRNEIAAAVRETLVNGAGFCDEKGLGRSLARDVGKSDVRDCLRQVALALKHLADYNG